MAVDYDPKKAHEYYMRHRNLKGRHSQKGFGETQKAQWYYAKEQLKEQKKDRDKTDSENIKSQRKQSLEAIRAERDRKKKQLADIAKKTSEQVKQLKKRLKYLPPEQRAIMADRIKGMIETVKDQRGAQRKRLSEQANAKSESVRKKASADLKSAKARSNEQYERDLDAAYKKIKG